MIIHEQSSSCALNFKNTFRASCLFPGLSVNHSNIYLNSSYVFLSHRKQSEGGSDSALWINLRKHGDIHNNKHHINSQFCDFRVSYTAATLL